MKIQQIKSANFKINKWTGGTTTQLFIYPPASNFESRDFTFRLSKATIETTFSEFTALPGFDRTLLVLEGATRLTHKNHHSKMLSKFDTDIFKGAWETESKGACSDFNLMTNGSINGRVNGQTFLKSQKTVLSLEGTYTWFFVYVNTGKVKINLKNNDFELPAGDLLVIEDPRVEKISFESLEKSDVVFVKLSE